MSYHPLSFISWFSHSVPSIPYPHSRFIYIFESNRKLTDIPLSYCDGVIIYDELSLFLFFFYIFSVCRLKYRKANQTEKTKCKKSLTKISRQCNFFSFATFIPFESSNPANNTPFYVRIFILIVFKSSQKLFSLYLTLSYQFKAICNTFLIHRHRRLFVRSYTFRWEK